MKQIDFHHVCMCVTLSVVSYSLQFDSMDYSLPGSSVHAILQARTLQWVAVAFSRGSIWPGDRTCDSRITGRLFTVWVTMEAHIHHKWYQNVCVCVRMCVCVCESISRVWLFATRRTVAHQAPLSMEFSRQEYWSGLPFPSPTKMCSYFL